MVLCPNCHRLATKGLLDEQEQRRYKAHPFNMTHGFAQGSLVINQRVFAVTLGGNQFVGDCTFIRVDDRPLLGLSVSPSGCLELSTELYDRDDNLLGLIDKNEWITGDPYPWDLEHGGKWLSIKSQPGDISLHVDARPRVVSVRGHLWFKRQRFDIKEDLLEFNGTSLQPEQSNLNHIGFSNVCFVGAGLIATSEPQSLVIAGDSRFTQYMLVSWPDPDERIQKGIEAWAKLTGKPISDFQVAPPNRTSSQMPLPHKYRNKRRKK